MFLKRIELSGFKSFANRTDLEFVKGITAVVGPNGSGKSNISDGIRWVLGEQSAKSLRGGKMEDVIFSGSDARRAVSFGEVSLTLDNGSGALPLDFAEVTVTRRVHRSGDSEYFINKQACRLKDITELFMDTGIGKEAYSIIGQGRIEEILSTKSEERRGIFEEASGIVKYKSRKKEAERKLADTEQNLLRIHDLVSELEGSIEPLRVQSAKAVRFKALKESLKQREIALYVYQIEGIHANWQKETAKTETLRAEQEQLAVIVNKHDAELEKQRFEARKLEEQLTELQGRLVRLSEEAEKGEGYGELLRERKRNFEQNRETLIHTISTQEERLAQREKELAEQQAKLADATARLSKLEQELAEEEIRLIGFSAGTALAAEESCKTELLDVMNAMAQSRNEIRYADLQLESLEKRLTRLEEDRSRWIGQREELQARREEIESKLAAAARELEASREQYMELAQALRDKEKLAETASDMMRKWEGRKDALVSRRDTMIELQNDYDGFMQGVKEVLKAGKGKGAALTGVRGAIAELVGVPADVEVAIETALGGALQNVVVETERDGREAIAFLKKRQLGRATFLPMDVIRSRHIGDSERRAMQGSPGFVGIAVDLVRFDAAYKDIFGSLLGNVIIAETLEDANRIAAKGQYRYRVVTRDGDVVNAGGSMTGGSPGKKSANLLGRQRQIEEIGRELEQADRQLSELAGRVTAVKSEIAAHNAALADLRDRSESKRIEEQTLLAEKSALESEQRNIEDGLTIDTQDRDSLLTEQTAQLATKTQSAQELERLMGEEARLREALRLAEQARKLSESAKEELQEQLTGLKVQAASVSQEKQGLSMERQRLERELAASREELSSSREGLEQLNAQIEANDQEMVQQLMQLNDTRIRRDECTQRIDFTRAERAELLETIEREEGVTRDQRDRLKTVEIELHGAEVRLGRLDVELDSLLKKLGEDYELSFELAKERYPVPEDIEAAQLEARGLKRDIAALGEVNLGAIEEFARVSERFEFLSGQKDDLIEAKTTLYGVIREMDEEMSRRFKQTYDAIRSHFGVVFAKLFGGGRADLVLSDPENLLETGIDIMAQPPGKKLQYLSLLSGGERALTAIALLFSILRVKPVPFCVLDEVEAALDEANVTRFAEYLREFSETTQFIVVTHRKGTMEEADVLYGVTMEEAGVSKLVSVRLDEEESAMLA